MADVYLREHPNRTYQQYRTPRRERLSGVIVIHTAENAPDHVAFDGGAEAVASWISRRPDPGSYHILADSDSTIRMVRFDDEAFHDATSGGNRHEIGLSVATRADVWPLAPKVWRDGATERLAQAAAEAARHVKTKTGVVVPARRITRAESEARKPGFISHGERDPARRSDPGKAFPWEAFLARYSQLMGGAKPPQPAPKPRPPSGGVVAPSGSPALRLGSKGTRVAELQVALNYGIGARLAGDASFGPSTEGAVKNLQRFFGLGVDGIYGDRSRAALQVACDAKAGR